MVLAEEIEMRIRNLQKAMQKEDLGGALLVQRADLFYFSGSGQNAHLFVPSEGKPTLVVKKSLARARQDSPLETIIPFESWDRLFSLVTDLVPQGAKLGLENDVLPANLYFRYQKMFNRHQLPDISKLVRQVRAVKSPYEIRLMQEAAVISESVFNHALKIIREGLSEVELAGQLEMHARKLGHQGAVRMRGFNQELYFGHIMSGESAAAISFFDGPTGGTGLNPSYPQGAGYNQLRRNEPILIDFVSIYGGYMVDQTRIFCIGELPLHLQEAFQRAVEIRNQLAEIGKPGTPGSALYLKAEQMAAEAGLGNHFMGYSEKVNFVGHGVGIELDELPVIARGFDQPLEKGMVFALEPKFIFPGEGVVGIEDTFVVNDTGLDRLTGFSDQLQLI